MHFTTRSITTLKKIIDNFKRQKKKPLENETKFDIHLLDKKCFFLLSCTQKSFLDIKFQYKIYCSILK